MEKKIFCFVIYKLVKILFTLLLILLMILWIVLGVETNRQINEVHHKLGRSRGDERRFLMQLNQAAVVPLFTRAALPRLYVLTILNSLIEELIALGALISILVRAKRMFIVMDALLTLIWFIEQYRIADFYHHIDSIDWQSSRIIVTTHAIHLIVIVFGFICILADRNHNQLTIRDDSVDNNNRNISTNVLVSGSDHSHPLHSRFVDLEPPMKRILIKNNNNYNNISNGFNNRFKKQYQWMRSTFIKRNNQDNNKKDKDFNKDGDNKSPNDNDQLITIGGQMKSRTTTTSRHSDASEYRGAAASVAVSDASQSMTLSNDTVLHV